MTRYKGPRSTSRQIEFKLDRIVELRGLGYDRAYICQELKISKWRYHKYLNRLKPPEDIVLDSTLKVRPLKKINKKLNPIEFCEQYLCFNPKPMQKLILKAFYNLELSLYEKKILQKLKREGKTTWEEGADYQELVMLIGMKGTKTTIASMISQIEEYELYKVGNISQRFGFIPGEEIYIINVATNKKQALATIFAKTKASIERSPYFKARNPTSTESVYHFRDTNVFLLSGHSNSSSLVGKTCKCVEFDELDRFQNNTTGKYSAEEVYEGMVRSTDPFGIHRRIVSLSSLVKGQGFMVHLFELSKISTTMLGFWMAEWEMNPELYSGETFFYKVPIPIEHKDNLNKNPSKFLRDKACIIGYTKGAYYREPDKVKGLFEQCHNEGYRPPVDHQLRFADWFHAKEGFTYYEHHDPSVSHDAYAIALGHKDGGLAILDLIFRFLPPAGGEIDIEQVREFCKTLHSRFPAVELITYDTWAASALMQDFEKQGLKTENLYIRKAQHDLLKEQIYSKKVRGQKYDVLIKELLGLELNGEKVDHHPDSSKDVADAVAGVVWHCVRKIGLTAGISSGTEDKKENTEPSTFLGKRRRVSIWQR